MGQLHPRVRFLFIFLLPTSLLVSGLFGFCIGSKINAKQNIEPQSITSYEAISDRHLQISVEVDSDAGFTTISSQELNQNISGKLVFLDVANVFITINDEKVLLTDAIRNGDITLEELAAQAQIDSRNGKCKENYTSELGLTRFIYRYDEFELMLVHDVFESPNGEQTLITDFHIYSPEAHKRLTYYLEDEDGNSLKREDWGLHFTVTDTQETTITLLCSQTGGQHVGELQVTSVNIITPENGYWKDISNSTDIPLTISLEATSELSFNLSSYFNSFPRGDYVIELCIEDIYNINEIHPLQKNFTDKQLYQVEFSIP